MICYHCTYEMKGRTSPLYGVIYECPCCGYFVSKWGYGFNKKELDLIEYEKERGLLKES